MVICIPKRVFRPHCVLCNISVLLCEYFWMAGALIDAGSRECQPIWLNLLGWLGGGVMCVRLSFFVWFTGILIRNVSTCNYNNQTGLVIITPCGHWSNTEETKRGFTSAFPSYS